MVVRDDHLVPIQPDVLLAGPGLRADMVLAHQIVIATHMTADIFRESMTGARHDYRGGNHRFQAHGNDLLVVVRTHLSCVPTAHIVSQRR
ncbi:hypothetical protein WT98_21480 [Burkholderia territorii]|nr:hypothetical protein WT98_21480 [Burkholderia territorii]